MDTSQIIQTLHLFKRQKLIIRNNAASIMESTENLINH